MRGTINIPGIGQILNLGVLARALESDDNANVLSTPNLLTLDNEEAKIIVAQQMPFVTGSYAQTGTTASVTPFQTIERKDVGLTLKIKPPISDNGTVKLLLYQEVSNVLASTIIVAERVRRRPSARSRRSCSRRRTSSSCSAA